MLLSLRSNPQTESPYIQECDSLCSRTDYHMLLPIVLHMVMSLFYSRTDEYLWVINEVSYANIKDLLSPQTYITSGLFRGLSKQNEECY